MLTYFRTSHQGTADALAIKAAETHLIKQAGFVGIDATAEILRMEIRKTARYPQPMPAITQVLVQQIPLAGVRLISLFLA